jgi:hypothetical protein
VTVHGPISTSEGATIGGELSATALSATGRLKATASSEFPAGSFVQRAAHSNGVWSRVPTVFDTGFYTNGCVLGRAALTYVETSAGHAVVTSPLSFAPEVQLSGSSQLADGRATVQLDPRASDVVLHSDAAPYRVQITPTGMCNGVAVTSKDAGSFVVEELMDGTSDASFDWFVVAPKRESLAADTPAALPEMPPFPLEGTP